MWDIAVPVEDAELREAAEFAADTASLYSNALLNEADEEEYRHRFAASAFDGTLFDRQFDWPRQTGGNTLRVTAVAKTDAGIDVTVCTYFTPGVFTESADDSLTLLDPRQQNLQFTSEVLTVGRNERMERGDQRLWWIEGSMIPDSASTTGACGPYRPEPFVVAPPRPVEE